MSVDPVIEENISALIESHFPQYFREEGPNLVAFVKMYYEWMESEGQVLYHSRRLPQYRDIDTTTEEFLVHFKEKYLKSIQLETTSNVRQLVKHSLDVYRAKGSDRAIDLLFRLVYGTGADVYYPATDIFTTSSGKWFLPQYLEVSPRNDLQKFVGKEIIGLNSEATAFVERVVRRKAGVKFIDTLYISALKGDFQTGELINTRVDPFVISTCPSIIGSLTNLTVIDGAANFEIGDIVDLTSAQGYRGKGRVSAISDATGVVTFDLQHGGYGYTANANVYVSANIVTVSEAVTTSANNYFVLFDQLTQPLANINYENANGSFARGDFIYSYHANNLLKGTGVVLSVSTINSTAGELFISARSGDLDEAAIYTTANAITANLAVANGYYDRTAYGNVISELSQLTITMANAVGSFANGEQIVQLSNSNAVTANAIITRVTQTLTSGSLTVNGHIGSINNSIAIIGLTSNARANVVSVTVKAGVKTVNNAFIADAYGYVYSTVGNTVGVVTSVSTGSGAGFSISPDLLYEETVLLNTDYLNPYLSTELGAASYSFPAMPSANANTIIYSALNAVSYDIGSIASLTAKTLGSQYTAAPAVRVFEPVTYPFARHDWLVDISNQTGGFQIGEMVTQDTTGARGLVLEGSDTITLRLQRLSLLKEIDIGPALSGELSGVTANVTFVQPDNVPRPWDLSERYVGVDAVIIANAQTSTGSVTTLDVVDSGFGYVEGEEVSFTKGDLTGSASASIEKQGTGTGFYKSRDGFLSDTKKLQDGDYYQPYSYEVRSSITLDRYRDMLREVLHVAGTKAFGALYYRATANVAVGIEQAIFRIS